MSECPSFIPVSAPDLSELEERYALEAIRSTWIASTGPWVDRFEREFAELCESPRAISVCNGTAALHLALLGVGVGPGDEVIVPSLTYIASTNAVHYCGATPVFVDVDPATWCIDPGQVERAITPRTRAIIAVHLYGHPCDMDALTALARRAGVFVIEDAAEAHFSTYRKRRIGSLGDVASFSFYGNKIVTSGEGGALTCRDPALEARMRQLRGQGMDPNRRYFFPVIGYNYRLTNVACAILCAQLERRQQILDRRAAIYARYREQLGGLPGLSLQAAGDDVTVAPWIFCLLVDPARSACDRDALMAGLQQLGIETRPFFSPNHQLPAYRGLPSSVDAALPHTITLSARGLNLPTHSGLSTHDIDRICDAIRSLVTGSAGPGERASSRSV